MIYGSVCSGIEAATVAWAPLGWTPAWYSEIEPFPCAVLKQRHPSVPNLGDMTKIHENETFKSAAIDLLVGGTPCQSFSVAGLRKGLADPRGNLALVFLALLDRVRPRWVVWENVPGVLSSWSDIESRPATAADYERAGVADPGNGRRGTVATQSNDFDTFLYGLRELGYGVAWRVLDAQYFGVPQRRRRVFVVGHLGNWRPAAAVLFERGCLSWDPPPSRKAGERAAGTLKGGSGSRGYPEPGDGNGGGLVEGFEIGPGGGEFTDTAPTLDARCKDGPIRNQLGAGVAHTLHGGENDKCDPTRQNYVTMSGEDLAPTLIKGMSQKVGTTQDAAVIGVAPAYGVQATVVGRSEKNGPNGKGHFEEQSPTLTKTDVHVVAFGSRDSGQDALEETSPTLRAGGNADSHPNGGVPPAVAFAQNQRDEVREMPVVGALPAEPGMKQQTFVRGGGMQVRRLTPRECERLQGFPDDYTLIKVNGKPAADGPRYKALGNSMAVPVMAWIGNRIRVVDGVVR